MGLLSKGKSSRSWGVNGAGRAGQGKQSWPRDGSQALPIGQISRHTYRIRWVHSQARIPLSVAGLRHSYSITGARTWGKGWSTGLSQVKGSAPDGASPRWSHSTFPSSLVPDCSHATSELAWGQPNLQTAKSSDSQTFRVGVRFCRVC